MWTEHPVVRIFGALAAAATFVALGFAIGSMSGGASDTGTADLPDPTTSIEQGEADTGSTDRETTTTASPETSSTTAATTAAPEPSNTTTSTSAAPVTQYLSAVEPNSNTTFVETGLASVSGVDYPNSVIYDFRNCGGCVGTIEYNLRREWTSFSAVVGLTDRSRSDDVINGVLTFTVVLDDEPGETYTVRRGEARAIEVDVSNVLFMKLQIGDGDNSEDGVWGDASLFA